MLGPGFITIAKHRFVRKDDVGLNAIGKWHWITSGTTWNGIRLADIGPWYVRLSLARGCAKLNDFLRHLNWHLDSVACGDLGVFNWIDLPISCSGA